MLTWCEELYFPAAEAQLACPKYAVAVAGDCKVWVEAATQRLCPKGIVDRGIRQER